MRGSRGYFVGRVLRHSVQKTLRRSLGSLWLRPARSPFPSCTTASNAPPTHTHFVLTSPFARTSSARSFAFPTTSTPRPLSPASALPQKPPPSKSLLIANAAFRRCPLFVVALGFLPRFLSLLTPAPRYHEPHQPLGGPRRENNTFVPGSSTDTKTPGPAGAVASSPRTSLCWCTAVRVSS